MAEKVKQVAADEAERLKALTTEGVRSKAYLYPIKVRATHTHTHTHSPSLSLSLSLSLLPPSIPPPPLPHSTTQANHQPPTPRESTTS